MESAAAWDPHLDLNTSLRQTVHRWLESSVPGDRYGYVLDASLSGLIIANVIAVILETVDSVNVVWGTALRRFELVSVIVFTAEYVLRVWSCTEDRLHDYARPIRGRLKFMLTPLAIIDLLAFAPFYLGALFGADLRMLRMLRLLRLLKLTRYSPALAVLGAVLSTQARALVAAGLIMAIALVFTSSIVFIVEREAQPEAFSSIPAAMWWGLATLTTVGFGDITPVTPWGRVFGALTMIMGVAMVALPTGVIATGFANEIRKRDFVINWRLVAKVPLFAGLDADQIAELVPLLMPRVVTPNHAIVRLGEPADAIYFIVSGRVEVDVPPEPIFLKSGDFFGEIGLLAHRPRTATVIALAHCQLLVLNADEFWHLLEKHPALRHSLKEVMAQRLLELEASNDKVARV